MDTTFKISIAGQDAATDDLALGNGIRDLGLERPGVANTGRATIANGVKAQGIKGVQ